MKKNTKMATLPIAVICCLMYGSSKGQTTSCPCLRTRDNVRSTNWWRKQTWHNWNAHNFWIRHFWWANLEWNTELISRTIHCSMRRNFLSIVLTLFSGFSSSEILFKTMVKELYYRLTVKKKSCSHEINYKKIISHYKY